MNALKADPRTVDLRALAPHFYNLGARILDLFEEEEMIEVLSDVRTRLEPRAVQQLTACSHSRHELLSLPTKHTIPEGL